MGGPSGRVLRPRLAPEPVESTYTKPHSLVVSHREHEIRAACTRGCDVGQWRCGDGAYEQIKQDWDKQHGGKR